MEMFPCSLKPLGGPHYLINFGLKFPPETHAKRPELDSEAVGNYFLTFLKLFEAGKNERRLQFHS